MGGWAGSSNGRKAPSAAADEVGTGGRHGSRQRQRGKNGGRRRNVGAVTSGVRGNKGGREASGVETESHGVGEGEWGREASGVAENPGGGAPWSGRESRVASGRRHPQSGRGPQGGRNPRIPHSVPGPTGGGHMGAGGRGLKPTHRPSN